MFIPRVYQRISHWLRQGIQRKLVFWSIGFWIISVSIISLTFLWTGQNEIMSDIRKRNVQIASVVSRDINSQISSILSDIRIFSHYLESMGAEMEDQTSALLTLRLSSPQRYHAAYYFNANNELLIHLADPLESLLTMDDSSNIVSRPSVPVDNEVLAASRAASETGTFISDVQFVGLDRIPVIFVAVPLSFSSTLSRVIVLQVDMRDIWQRINLSTVGESGYTYAVSQQGIIIAHPDPAYLGRDLPSELEPVLDRYEGFTEYNEHFTQRAVYAAYSPVGGPTGWGIVVEQDKSEANAPIIRVSIIIIIIWLALATIGTVGILIMTRNFTRPIVELTNTTQEIERTGKLTKTSMEERPDEVGQLSQSFDQMIERLQSMEGRLATVAIEERNRLARDLHDAVSQTLFSASLIAEVLPRLWERSPEEGLRRLEEVRQLTRGALAEMRTLLLELRPTALVEAELPNLLSQLAESISGRTRVPVTVSTKGDCSFPADVKVALYRIAQEALNNVAKHAGATEVKVNLLCEPDKVTLKITDDGKGFDMSSVPSDSLGIGIMHERAGDIGASLSMQSWVGRGTEIMVVWDNLSGEEHS